MLRTRQNGQRCVEGVCKLRYPLLRPWVGEEGGGNEGRKEEERKEEGNEGNEGGRRRGMKQ